MRFFRGHQAPHRGVSYSPNGTEIFTASSDGIIKSWDTRNGSSLRQLSTEPSGGRTRYGLDCLAVSPVGNVLAAAGNGVTLWNLDTDQRVRPSHNLQRTVTCLDFSSDGQQLAATSFWPDEGHGIHLFNTTTGERIAQLSPGPKGVWGLAFAPDGKMVAGGTPEGALCLWDIHTRSLCWRWDPPDNEEGLTNALAFSPDGRWLVLASKQFVLLFDPKKGRLISAWKIHPKHHVNVLRFSPNSRILATGGNDRLVRFWDETSFKKDTLPRERLAYDWGTGKVRGIAFSPDGMTAAAVGENRKIVIWDVMD